MLMINHVEYICIILKYNKAIYDSLEQSCLKI